MFHGTRSDTAREAEVVASLRAALGSAQPWRARAGEIAHELLAADRGPAFGLEIQRIYRLLPPDTPAGEALFRLAEALPRTTSRADRLALVAACIPALRSRTLAALALPFLGWGIGAVGRQFVYAERIDAALARACRAARRDAGVRFSFDMLGEGARSAADAERNFRRYLTALEAIAATARSGGADWPDRLGVSLKLSSIHPRYDAASYRLARGALLDRLGELCRTAAAGGIGFSIDAEESERAALQFDLLEALALDGSLLAWSGLGTVVQAYRVGVAELLERVLDLAHRRVAAGGTRLHVRLVKGAYWDAEIKRAQELGLRDYPVFTERRATDLAYVACAKRLLSESDAVHAQFATHNPVTLGCVLALAGTRGALDAPADFECQRLHGMGAGLETALRSKYPGVPVRIYAPVGDRRELLAYLVRRLLENGASGSYVRQAARATDRSALLAENLEFLDPTARPPPLPLPMELHLPERLAARGYDLGDSAVLATVAAAVGRHPRGWSAAPLVGGRRVTGDVRRVVSPARPDVEIGRVVDATPDIARTAVAAAHAAHAAWAGMDLSTRAATIERLAAALEANLAELMALCVWETGKTLPDALADVREAVDLCRYYAAQARRTFGAAIELPGPVGERNVLSLHGRGVFACISPWNFPVAIFTGQIAAALLAGNTVVAKPAEQASLSASRVADLLLEAGVPPEVFHLLPGDGESVGGAIVCDARIAGVVFTGSMATARAIQRALAEGDRPIVPLIAETGGLNAMIVDATALPEQVVDAVVASAFRSAGQRCSSLRVLYLQHEIAPAVLAMLRGAMAELRIGDPSDPATDVGPVIDAQAQRMLAVHIADLRCRATLIAEAGPVPAAGHYVAPVAFEIGAIGELPGERFGPVLHVVRFAIEDLDRILDEINATGYGLTMGLHTRVDSRAVQVRNRAAVGNLYVNRNMIGATVGVQPFGGGGLSGTGPKAGGPHYLPRFAIERVCTVNTAAAGGDLQFLARRN